MNNLASRANLHSSKTHHKVTFSIYKQRAQPFGKFQYVPKNSSNLFNNTKHLSFTYTPSNNLLTRQNPPILDFKRYLAIDNNTIDKTPQTTTLGAEKSTPVSEKSTTTESYETKQENKAAQLETLANVKPSYMDRTKAFLKPLPGKIWHEIVNLWNGSKLLAFEVKVCTTFIKKIMNGQSLSRREKRQLLRTSADLLRLVPFVIILVVPFLEFALPVLLKLFPNMLPSTFTDSMKKEEIKKQQLQVKLEVASFLQQAVHERAKSLDKDNVSTEFANYIEKVQQGATISNTDLVKFAHFFEDEFTLDNLQREQLIAMCKYMQLNTFGTNGFLRYQLTHAIKKIKNDDRMIETEGVESLTLSELQQACAARGLKGTSRSKYYLQERLREWLDLSLTRNLPISLLILANAFKITAKISPKDALREALYHIPDSLLDELKLKVSEAESAKLKLEVLKKEEQAIKLEELEAPKTTKEIQREQLLEWILQKQDIAQSSVTFTASQLKAITDAVGKLAAETTLEREQKQILELKQVLEKKKKELAEKEEEMKLKRKLELEQVEIDKKKAEEELTKKLMNSNEDLDIGEIEKKRKELVLEEELEEKKREKEEKRIQKETKSLNRIEGILETFVKDIEDDLKEVTESSKVFNILDKDKDGVVSVEEIKEAAKLLREKLPEEALTVVIDSLDADHDGKISLEELKPLADKLSEAEKEKKDEQVKANEVKDAAEVKESAEVKEVKETVQSPVEVKDKSQTAL